METQVRRRDGTAVRLERDAYAVLMHVYTLALADPDLGPIRRERIDHDLGFHDVEGDAVIQHLLDGGYLDEIDGAGQVRLTQRGQAYLEHHAGRRRSVR